MLKRTRSAHGLRATAAAVILSFALTMSLVPASAWAVPSTRTAPAPTSEQIQAMLAGRDYVEGEAIVVAEAGARLTAGDVDELSTADDEALELTAEAARTSDEPAQVAASQRAELSDANAYQITVVRSSDTTTARLIEELYANPQVISAEPNYVVQMPVAPEGTTSVLETQASGDDASAGIGMGVHDPEVGDLSSLQWYLGTGGGVNTLQGDGVDWSGMDVPGYAGGGVGELNSSPQSTIAVIDSGMDLTHPDLESVFYTFSAEQQQRFGCGEHGLNASVEPGSEDVGDLTEMVDHGTHVAGIMGAAWDGHGTAGIANGAKLVGVRLANEWGAQNSESALRGFDFLIKTAREINLKAVNCSWGSNLGVVEFTFTLLVNQLGRQGALTVFAAANDDADLDQEIATGAYIDSPYLIVVDSMSPSGTKASYSNYGATQTDLFAPGSAILSTVPASVGAVNEFAEGKAFFRYYPQSGQGVGSLSTFGDGTDGGVTVYSENPVSDTQAKPVAVTVTQDAGVDDEHALLIARDAFVPYEAAPKEEGGEEQYPRHRPGSVVYVKMPTAAEADAISCVSAMFTANLWHGNVYGSVFGLVVTTHDGGTKVVDLSWDDDGCYNSASARTNSNAWTPSTINVKHLLASDDEAESVYLDEGGNMVLVVGLDDDGNEIEGVYVDNIAIGTDEAHASAHVFYNGTSMAAPTVTGAMAVVARDERPNSVYEAGEELGLQALKRSARLRAATIRTSELDGLCATGGYVRLTPFKNYASTEDAPLAPIIESAKESASEPGTIEVAGYFFGSTSGNAFVDGIESPVVSWSENAIAVALPEGTSNGDHVLTIETEVGVDRAAFSSSHEDETTPLRLFEADLAIPDMNACTDGVGNESMTGGLVGSGDYLYTMQEDFDGRTLCLWKYRISDDSWTLCAELPFDVASRRGNTLAATDEGVVLYTTITSYSEEGSSETEKCLYDYDESSDSWSKREVTTEIPDSASIYSRDGDLFFVGGSISGEEDSRLLFLSVLREGSDELEVLGEPSEDFEYGALLSYPNVAASDRNVYLAGEEFFSGDYPLPWGLIRLTLDESDRVVDTQVFFDELEKTGIVKAGFYRSTVALAGMPCGVAIVGRETEGTDTHLLRGGSDTFEEYDRTSSYYRDNSQLSTYYDGRLYVMGFSPSEPGKMYLRSTAVEINHVWDEGTVTKEPTCGEPGERTFACTQCGLKRTEPIEATGKHSWDGGVVSKDPTATTAGERIFICTTCGATRTEAIPPTEVTVSYACVSGNGSSWTKGAKTGLEFRFARSVDDSQTYERFRSLQIDGKTVEGSNYGIKQGSLVVSLKAAYLQNLSEGSHTIRATFDDGTADASFTVVAASSNKATKSDTTSKTSAKASTASTSKALPKTGDTTGGEIAVAGALAVALLLASAMTHDSKGRKGRR